MLSAIELQNRRRKRVRSVLRERAKGRPRLSVFRSNLHIYVQVIDDRDGKTLEARARAGGSKSARISPFDGEAFLISAISP